MVDQKQRLDAAIRGLQTKMTALQEEHADLSDAHTSLSQSTSSTAVSLKSQIASVRAEQTTLQAALDESRALVGQHEATITSLRSQLLSQSQEEPKPSMDEQEARDTAVVRDELHRQASYLRSLEKANVKLTREVTVLQENHASLEVVREEKRGLERKVWLLDEMRNKVVKLEAEVEAARKEREAWSEIIIYVTGLGSDIQYSSRASSHPQGPSSLSSSTSGAPPVALTQQLAALRLEHANLLEGHGSTAALLRSREAELDATRTQVEKLTKTVVSLEEHIRTLDQKVLRRETRLAMADREIGFLQALVVRLDLIRPPL